MSEPQPQEPQQQQPTCMTCGAPVATPRHICCDLCRQEHRLRDLAILARQGLESGTYDHHRIASELRERIARERAQAAKAGGAQ